MRLGFGEIVVILALALLFFGPSKLPKLGQSLGEAIRGLKRGLAGDDPTEPTEKVVQAQQLPPSPSVPTTTPAPQSTSSKT